MMICILYLCLRVCLSLFITVAEMVNPIIISISGTGLTAGPSSAASAHGRQHYCAARPRRPVSDKYAFQATNKGQCHRVQPPLCDMVLDNGTKASLSL